MTMKRLWTMAPVLAALGTASLLGTSVRVVNLPQLMGSSTRIFRGECLSTKTLQDSAIGLPVVEFTFRVKDGVRGVKTGETLVFRQVQSKRAGLPGIPAVPTYRKGDDMVLFLAGDSEFGLTSPVGLGQGAFSLKLTPRGLMAVNSVQNKNLTLDLEVSKAVSIGLSPDETSMLRKGEAIPLEAFMSVIRKIDHAQTKNGRVQ